MSSNVQSVQPAMLPPNPAAAPPVRQPGVVRRAWRQAKRLPLLGGAWTMVRSTWFKLGAMQQRISYIPRHAKLRREPWTKLQLGAGENVLRGWLNTDLRPSAEVLPVDVTRVLPFADGSFKRVLSEHMIEHLSFQDGRRMLLEIHRVLESGGRVRLSTPDFNFLMGLFREDLSAEEREFMEWHVKTYSPALPTHPLTVTNTMFRRWGHEHLYNEETLSALLVECGFGQIARFQTGESDDPEFRGVEFHGKFVGNETHNRIHTLVLEATKS